MPDLDHGPMGAGAFRGDPALKADLLAALEASAAVPLVAPHATQSDLVVWAAQVGLPPALVLMLSHLVRRFGAGRSPAMLAREVLSAVNPGDTLDAASHLLTIWVWEAAPDCLQALMPSAEPSAAASDVIALHRRAAAGTCVARQDWRASRTRLARLDGAGEEEAVAAGAVAACAWDYGRAPGAAVDLLSAWEGVACERILRADGWGEAETARLHQFIQDQNERVIGDLGPAPDDADPQAAATHASRVTAELQRRVNASGDPLLARKAGLNAKMSGARTAMRAEATAFLDRVLSGDDLRAASAIGS